MTYLLDCSDATLQDVALARMDKAANLRKVLRELLDEIVDEMLFERLCRYVKENRSWLAGPRAQLPLPLTAKKPPTKVRGKRREAAA